MKNRMRGKIRSRTGASITFALLIFLVCAVVGSVVLVAGTAAAGRMSKIAESDQRYYSVNSAARLLIGLVDGKEITIIETQKEGETARTYKDYDGITIDGSSFNALVKEAAYYYIKEIAPTGISNRKGDTACNLSLAVGDKAALNVAIKEELMDDGTMVLTLSHGSGEATYAMKLTFSADSPDAKKVVDVQTQNGITTTVTTWKIAWHIQNVEVVGGGKRTGATA